MNLRWSAKKDRGIQALIFFHLEYLFHTNLISPTHCCNTWDRHCNILDRIGNSLHLSWANEHSLARFTSSFPVATRSEKGTKSIRALLWLLKVLSWKSWAEKRTGPIHQSFDITCRHLFAHHYLLHMAKACCVAWSNKNIKLQCSECRMTLYWFQLSEPSPNL